MNASASDFLTLAAPGFHWIRRLRPSRNCYPASCAKAPSRPAGHARHARVGGAKRRALHGVEHSSKLGCVVAAGLPPCHTGVRGQPDNGEICFPEDMSNPSHTQVTCGRRRRRTMDAGQAPTTLAVDGWGVSDPGAIAWGEVGRRKPRVAHAPVRSTDRSAP